MDNWGTSIYEYCREVGKRNSVANGIVKLKFLDSFFNVISNILRELLNTDNLKTSDRS